jgi:hypothetical protein
MNFRIFHKDLNFVITNSVVAPELDWSSVPVDKWFFIYGYCFLENSVQKNCLISEDQYDYIVKNRSIVSGIFILIGSINNRVEITFDPLVQYPCFYYISGNIITISNSILAIAKLHSLNEFDDRYLFDSIAYQSPLRGLTILKDIFVIQHDDLNNDRADVSYFKPMFPLVIDGLKVFVPDKDFYSNLSYNDLLNLYIDRLSLRSKIISDTYSEVHLQLTGGADSRLALSSLLKYKNLYCYVYGDGFSQNRLIFDMLVSYYGLKVVNNIIFCGASLNSSSLIIKGGVDSNFRKLNNLDTYMNSNEFLYPDKCKITGYYGANVSGGVPGPPDDPMNNSRTKFVPSQYYDYHDYLYFMKYKYSSLRPAAFDDIFYINNRGQSHYSCHSIADNLKCNSFDILYDPINLELVKKCPYSDTFIARNAISVDLTYINSKKLALFPYDSRSIPRFRDFDDIPVVNCFDGLLFRDNPDVKSIPVERPIVNSLPFDLLDKSAGYVSVNDMLKYKEFDYIFEKYDFLNCLRNDNNVTSSILLNYILGVVAIKLGI